MKKVINWVLAFEKYVDQWWYAPALGLICALDHYVLVFPILGMLISSIFLKPRNWLSLTLWSAFGSWLGALVLALLVQTLGIPFLLKAYPEMLQSPFWSWTQAFFLRFGVWVVFLVGLAPAPQQPPVIIASLAGTPLWELGSVLLGARLIKFTVLGFLSSHAPQKLSYFKSLRKEMEELHVPPPTTFHPK